MKMIRTKEKILRCLELTSLFMLLVFMSGRTQAFADVTEGQRGETYSGEYVVIVNTNPSAAESTGTLNFVNREAQGSAETAAVNDTALLAIEEDLPGEDLAEAGLNVEGLTEEAAETFALKAGSGTTQSYTVGQQKYFYCYGGAKQFTCIKSGQSCYIWMENSMKADYENAGKLSLIADEAAEIYDGQSFQTLNDMCGGNFGYRDNSGKLSIALEAIAGGGTSGVYMGKYNEPDVTAIHVNIKSASEYRSGSLSVGGLLVHEGQHALFEQSTDFYSYGRYMWINEGLSVAAMEYFWGGSDNSSWLNYIAGNNTIRNGSALIYNSYRGQSAIDYAMPYLFVRYLTNRLQGGYDLMGFFQKVYAQSGSGIDSSVFVKNISGIPFAELLADFYTAIAAGDASGKYGFNGDVLAQKAANSYPCYQGASGSSVGLDGTAAIILHLAEGSSFTVPLDGGTDVKYRIVGKRTQVVSPSQGKGTAAEPYLITSAREWNLIGNNTGAYYKLANDISFAGIGQTTVEQFSGTIDGAGHTVSGLTGPIAGTNLGTIKNLVLNVQIGGTASDYQGAVVRENQSKIDSCIVNGTITLSLTSRYTLIGTVYGIIAGQNTVNGVISNCSATAEVSISSWGTKARIGGIVGINSGSVKRCTFKGQISVRQQDGSIYAGGIAGEINRDFNLGGSLEQCMNTGSISAAGAEQSFTGQICGFAAQNIVDRGIENYIKNCYGKAGDTPLVGSPELKAAGNSKLLTDEEAKSEASYQGWDFGADWKLGEDGPQLKDESDITSITAQDYRRECFVGEKIEYYSTSKLWGQLLVNGTSLVPITDDMVSGFDSSKQGTTTVVVSYKGLTTSYTMQIVNPKQITSLVFSSAVHVSYHEGDLFNPEGIVLYGTIDGRPAFINGGFACDQTPLAADQTSVTINYFGISVEIPIKVTGIALKELKASGNLTKTQYSEGDTLDLSAIQAQLIYNDGNKTAMFGEAEFESNGIGIALMGKDGSSTAVSRNVRLSKGDNGKTVFLYKNSLPGQGGSINASIGTISVYAPLSVETNDVYIARGTDSFSFVYALGGSESYETDVIFENLPSGIIRDQKPGKDMYAFVYSGKTMVSGGEYKCQYRLRDTQTGSSILVDMTLHVQASDFAKITVFDLERSWNSALGADVKGIIEDGRIILKVPKGTDVSNLQPSLQYVPNPGAACNYWNGTKLDFSKPVTYILTAPDGVTKISYDIVLEYVDVTGSQPGTDGGSQPGIDGGSQPGIDGGSQPGTDGGSQPGTDTGSQPGTDGGSQPGTDTGLQPGTDGGSQPGPQPQPQLTVPAQGKGVVLNASSLPIQVKKSTTVLKIASKDSTDSVLKWSSSNEKVIAVNAKTGKITAKKTGTAYVKVQMKSGASAKCKIKVQKKKVVTTKINLNKKSISLRSGQKYKIQPIITPLTTSDKTKFISSNKRVADVTSKGVVLAKKKGTAVITVQSGKKKVKLKVTVK